MREKIYQMGSEAFSLEGHQGYRQRANRTLSGVCVSVNRASELTSFFRDHYSSSTVFENEMAPVPPLFGRLSKFLVQAVQPKPCELPGIWLDPARISRI